MNIALAGFDTEGRSSYDYFTALGHDVTILDQNETLAVPDRVTTKLGADYLSKLDQFDLIVRTAGLPPKLLFAGSPGLDTAKVTTQINEFFAASPTKNIIGITGTKGKGTTSSLIFEMLKADGNDVYLAGNIGVPALDVLPLLTPDSWVVLELSSFQLIDLKQSPAIGVCLMVVPEHLNWHTDMAEYLTAKSQLFQHQTAADKAVYFAENDLSKQIASSGSAALIPFYAAPGAVVQDGQFWIGDTAICPVSELKLLGKHNWQNACAALTAVWQVTQNVTALRAALANFAGLEHRLEYVRTVNDVTFYDDSFGTTPETAIVALAALPQPKVIILGGSDKGADYAELARAVKANNVRRVVLIGEQAGSIQSALEAVDYRDFIAGGATMAAIIDQAMTSAEAGDAVLLSTGCASFDMFANYKDRGNQFKAAVQALAAAA